MKDRPADQLRMEEVAARLGDRGTGKKGVLMVPDSVILGADNTEAERITREVYNKGIRNIPVEYSEFVPYRKVIVRCYVLEYIEKNGILVKPEIMVPMKTPNGYTVERMVNSPYPYSRRAVVVSVPENFTSFNAGDEVLLDKHVVLANKENKNADFHLPHGFTTDSWPQIEPPTNMKDEHYGYLIVEPNTHILGKLKSIN